MVTLCEDCLKPWPIWTSCEIKAIVPLSVCEMCGARDNRFDGGPKVHLFGTDPRKVTPPNSAVYGKDGYLEVI